MDFFCCSTLSRHWDKSARHYYNKSMGEPAYSCCTWSAGVVAFDDLIWKSVGETSWSRPSYRFSFALFLISFGTALLKPSCCCLDRFSRLYLFIFIYLFFLQQLNPRLAVFCSLGYRVDNKMRRNFHAHAPVVYSKQWRGDCALLVCCVSIQQWWWWGRGDAHKCIGGLRNSSPLSSHRRWLQAAWLTSVSIRGDTAALLEAEWRTSVSDGSFCFSLFSSPPPLQSAVVAIFLWVFCFYILSPANREKPSCIAQRFALPLTTSGWCDCGASEWAERQELYLEIQFSSSTTFFSSSSLLPRSLRWKPVSCGVC